MPRVDFLFPTFAKGLADSLANDTAPIETLRACDNVDFAEAPIGGITIRPPTTLRSQVAIRDQDTVPHITGTGILNDFRANWLFRLSGYETDNWPYLLIGSNGVYKINRHLNGIGDFAEFEQSTNSKYAVLNENKIYFIGRIFPTVMEKEGEDLTVRDMGFQAGLFTLATNGNADVNLGKHYYQLILTDENGHRSVPLVDPPSITLNDSAQDKVRISDMPVCNGQYKYLYRSLANAEADNTTNPLVFYLVKVLDSHTETYDDSDTDATIAVNDVMTDDGALPPQDLVYAIIHNGIMWGFTEKSSILRYTPQFDYENWRELNAIPIGDPDYLVSINPVGDRLLIFKKNKIFAFWGTSILNMDYREISNIHGTKYPHTIKTIDENRLIFLDSHERVILYNGGQLTEISKPIKIPLSTRYWGSLYRDYYILWMYEDRGIWRDRQGEDLPVVLAPGPGDDEPPPPPPPGWDDAPPPMDLEILNPGDPTLPEDDEVLPDDGWVAPDEPKRVIAYAYHVPTGAWSRWTNIQAQIPEQPDRPIDNLVFWNGNEIEVLGRGYHETFSKFGAFVIRTHNTNCGTAIQKKSFKEIELYFEYLSSEDFEGMFGQLELIVDDGSDTSSLWQQTITYDTDSPVNRLHYRLPAGINGTRASLRFIGNQYMNKFAVMQARLWWEPRGTPQR